MKVFQVISERIDEEGRVVDVERYVTATDNSLKTVCDWYTRHCDEYEENLKLVREVITVCHQIQIPEDE